MKNPVKSIAASFTKPRKLNYALVLIIMAAYSATFFLAGMMIHDTGAKSQAVSIIKVPVAQAASKALSR